MALGNTCGLGFLQLSLSIPTLHTTPYAPDFCEPDGSTSSFQLHFLRNNLHILCAHSLCNSDIYNFLCTHNCIHTAASNTPWLDTTANLEYVRLCTLHSRTTPLLPPPPPWLPQNNTPIMCPITLQSTSIKTTSSLTTSTRTLPLIKSCACSTTPYAHHTWTPFLFQWSKTKGNSVSYHDKDILIDIHNLPLHLVLQLQRFLRLPLWHTLHHTTPFAPT